MFYVVGIPSKDHPLLIRKILKSLWFVISYTEKARRYRLKSFGRPANEHKYTKNESEQITVVDFFRDTWNYRLCYTHLPVVELYDPDDKNQSYFLPMELVNVDEGQPNLQPLTSEQHAKATNKTVVHPDECYRMIRRVTDERRFKQDPYLEKFGLTVDVDEMLMLPARILPPPKIIYKSSHGAQGDVIERVQIGKWWLNNRFDKTCEIRTWAVVLVSEREPDNRQIRLTRDFAQRISQAMSKYDIRFNSSPIEKFDAAVPQTILARMNELKMQEYEVIIYILDQVDDEIYHLIKYFGNIKIGMVTQCIRFDQLMSNSDPREMDMYIQNLVEKFNARLRGVNQLVSLMPALISPLARSNIFMFFGIDCTHITCSHVRPSIVAVVGSKDSTNTQYAARVLQQFPQKGKIAFAIINDLHKYVVELIRVFSNHNSCLPNKLVFYQVGLDDGSFEKMLDNELRAIQRACQGTVLDTDIVSLNGFEFYLNSDATIQGTSRPMLYKVLYDEIGFTLDDIQQLTYYLCHIDVRCTKAIYVPAPVHCATLHVSHHLELHYKSQMSKDMNEINHAMLKYCIQFNLSSIEKFEAGVPQTILVHMNELKM
ncbi:unnamed protein product [Rotaria sp. Silwood2]|nr:unnamed protein product [Rotaria sp. Silwood2]